MLDTVALDATIQPDMTKDHGHEVDRLRAMQGFVAITEVMNFRKAAENLSIETSTLSRRIIALEKELNVQLFTRTTRVVSLTEAGKVFLERARRILAELDEMDRVTRDFALGVGGTLRISTSSVFSRLCITPYLGEFFNRYPDIKIDLLQSDYPVDVVSERADMSIQVAMPHKQDYVVRRLAHNERIVVGSPDYIRTHGAPQNLHELKQHSCIVLTNYFSHDAWHFVDGSEERSVRVSGPFRVTNAESLLQAACEGIGLIWISRLFADEAIRSGKLVRVLTQWRSPSADIYACMPPQRYLSGRVHAFFRHLESVLERQGKR